MYDLGKIKIDQTVVFKEIRRKIKYLASGIELNDFLTTRMVTIVSEVIRQLCTVNDAYELHIELENIHQFHILKFRFEGLKQKVDMNQLTDFFDVFEYSQKSETLELLTEIRKIKIDTPITLEITDYIKSEIEKLSRDELLNMILSKNEELKEAKFVAENAAKTKSDFLANMSHEIRTPMNAILGMAYLINKTELDEQQKNYLNGIQTSGQHLLGVINDILDFSKIEAGKLNIEKTEFELNDVFSNLSSLISEKCENKGLELVFDVDTNLPNFYYGDPLRIGQILINYTNNAIKFTEKGEIVVRVKIEQEYEKKYLLRFEVCDTGVGLSDEQMVKLFKSFQQADTSTSRKYGGTGLGLAISKNLANLMDGEVGVNSKSGEGSTFWFTVTVGKSVTNTSKKISGVEIQNLRGLVVDDNLTCRNVIGSMLTSLGMIVDSTSSGVEAVELIREKNTGNKPYDIIYVDYKMPALDGLETIRRIEKLDLTSKPKCIMITGFSSEVILNQSRDVDIEMVVTKPVNPTLLQHSTVRVLGGEIIDNEVLSLDEEADIHDKMCRVSKVNILLVEDNETNQFIALELLAQVGLSADVAENGKVGVEKVRTGSYDIVLMDMQMPVMDGIEASKIINSEKQDNKLSIIAMTANAMSEDKTKCIEAGMVDFIAKPIVPLELYKTLLKWTPSNLIQESIPNKKNIAQVTENVLDLKQIKSIDLDIAMKNVGGDNSMLNRILYRFYSDYVDYEKVIIGLLELGKDENIRYYHTLKSVAATIGHQALADNSKTIELKLKKGQLQVDELVEFTPLHEICGLFEAVFKELDGLFSTEKEEFESPILLCAQIFEEKIIKLKCCIEDYDSAAEEILVEIKPNMKQKGLLKDWEEIAKYLHDYEFDTAGDILNALDEHL